ncbi:hypothetical protein LUZ60_000076 [Juncus effusus]|nr:hypothetical protein LUZ60_000076 [Juncus effusus]
MGETSTSNSSSNGGTGDEKEELGLSLLEAGRGRRRRGGGATWVQTLGNIVVSIVGTGVLGLPYTFRVAGWLAGSLGVATAGLATFYCMLLLIECRDKIQESEAEQSTNHYTYGDLGKKAFGLIGGFLTELLVLVSQAGGSVAYLVFIGQNLSSVFSSPPSLFIFTVLLPLQILLSFVRSLSSLSPFSIFADLCNVVAMAVVIKEDFEFFDHPFGNRNAFNGFWGLPFAGGVAVFCFEGFTMTLALEASMAERSKFKWVLAQAFVAITSTYVFFGIFGYLAYGDETKDIITLNLPNNWLTAAVKIGLCIALSFTFPIMMHPIHEIIEGKLHSIPRFQTSNFLNSIILHLSRIAVVGLLALLASFIPGFGSFVSFVGSTVCALLSFVLPAIFHLTFMGSCIGIFRKVVDYGILIVGLVFAAYGTYDAIVGNSAKL